jgi:hypothetical protein
MADVIECVETEGDRHSQNDNTVGSRRDKPDRVSASPYTGVRWFSPCLRERREDIVSATLTVLGRPLCAPSSVKFDRPRADVELLYCGASGGPQLASCLIGCQVTGRRNLGAIDSASSSQGTLSRERPNVSSGSKPSPRTARAQ